MRRLLLFALLAATAWAAEKVEILRDEYGVPHIFAASPEGAAYVSGYLQARERAEQLEKHLASAKRGVSVAAGLKSILAAFCAGIKAGNGAVVDPASVAGFAATLVPRGTTVVIPAEHTASHIPIEIIDPIEDYGDISYQVVVGAGSYNWAGAAPVGLPFPLTGHGVDSVIGPKDVIAGDRMLEQVWSMQNSHHDPAPAANPSPQAAQMTRALIDFNSSVTIYDALKIASSADVYKADFWQKRIAKADADSSFARLITGWSRRAEFDSIPALAFYLFKMALGADSAALEPPDSLSDNRLRAVLQKAQDQFETQYRFQAAFGTVFQIMGQGASGGDLRAAGMATPRAIDYEKHESVMRAVRGPTATQIVERTLPVPKSYMLIPASGSVQRFARGEVQPTYFGDRKELEKHVKSRQTVTMP